MGARFIVTMSAADAVTLAASALKKARFAPAQRDISAKVAAQGSGWIARALSIGRPSRRGGSLGIDGEFFPLNLIPLFWPRVAATLAIVCTRPTDAGTELVLFAHPSMLHAGERTNDSRPLVANAYADLSRRFAASGSLLSHEPLADVAALSARVDETCPASDAFVRRELGWS